MKNLNRSVWLFTSLLALTTACSGSETVEDPATGDDAPAGDDDTMGDDDAMGDDVMADDDTAAMGDDDTAMPSTPEPSTVDVTDVFSDFEGWDGATALPDWTFQFGPLEMPYTAGPYAFEDMTGEFVLEMVAGQGGSQYAISFSNASAADWGGGVGFWMGNEVGAVDLSGYTGVSFYVRGSTPAGTMGFTIGTEALDACADTDGCKGPGVEFSVPADWTKLSFDFADFQAGVGLDGAAIGFPVADATALSFGAHMVYVQDASGEWVPEPGAYEIAIDDIVFH